MSPLARQTSRQGARTRRRILDAAIDQFGRNGYRACSLARIAEQAGVGQSNILHHFGSKAELLTTVLSELYFPTEDGAENEDGTGGGEEPEDQAAAEDRAGSGAGPNAGLHAEPAAGRKDPEQPATLPTLADTFLAMAEESSQTAGRVRFFSVLTGESLTEDHPAQTFFRARYDALRSQYAARLDHEAAEAGVALDPGVRDSVVNLAVAALDGLQLQWLRNPQDVDLVREVEPIAELLRQVVRPDGSSTR